MSEENDDVLVAVADQIPLLIPFIGGSEFAYLLLEPLRRLVGEEDLFVREKVRHTYLAYFLFLIRQSMV